MKKVIELNEFILNQKIDELINIDFDFPGGSWIEENFKLELEGKYEYSLLFQLKERIVGYIIASIKNTHIHIHRFSIHKDYRNKGFGLALLSEFEKRCKLSNRFNIGLNVSKINSKAIEFYLRNGFVLEKDKSEDIFFVKKLEKVVAIHQPNLFPWLGFFDKINKSDVFIVLDHVLNRPNDAIYTKRVQILNNKMPYWLTIPLLKPKGIEFVSIKEMKINLADDFARKQLKTIEHNYQKTTFFNEVFPLIENFYSSGTDLIAKRNIDFIKNICTQLQIATPFINSSDLDSNGTATELLIDLTRKVNADVYLAGGGASGYQQDQLLNDAGIKLVYQNFKHPVYFQKNADTFTPGLSILDCLVNNGFEKTKELLTFAED